MGSLLVAGLAGALTTLSPCVLPILPLVLLSALDQHRWGPAAMAAGLALAFCAAGVLLAGAGFALEVPTTVLRGAGAGLMAAAGIVLISRALQERFAIAASALGGGLSSAAGRFQARGLTGQFLLGALLGLVWTPCSGPTLGAAVSLAASRDTLAQAAGTMLCCGAGACVPLLAIAYGSRRTLVARRRTLATAARAARPWLGGLLIAVAALILAGLDKSIEARLTAAMPDWLVGLTTRF